MLIIYCQDVLHPRQPDEAYALEAQAAAALGLPWVLFDFEALVNSNNPAQAIRKIPTQEYEQLAIYRGWMLKPKHYAALYEALKAKGVCLINNPDAYRHCHYLPESYAVIESFTPKSVWLKLDGPPTTEALVTTLQPLGDGPIIVKDFVKSQKHYWHEAFFIPAAADHANVERVVNRFLALQGGDLNEGLVFRQFVEFEPLAMHSRSGMPLTKEYRVFVLDGVPLCVTPYWEDITYQDELPSLDPFQSIMKRIESRFFTMDIARRKDGEWMIVELGDAQVAGLPEHADVQQFYHALG